MTTVYRGHTIDVTRERSLGGWVQTYYSIFRQSDGYECTSGFYDGEETVAEFTQQMKERVDNELADADPWEERANNERMDAAGIIRTGDGWGR